MAQINGSNGNFRLPPGQPDYGLPAHYIQRYETPHEYIGGPQVDIEEASATAGLAYYLRIAWSHKGLLTLTALLGSAAGILLTIPQTRMYHAQASLEIQNINQDFLNMRDVAPNTPYPPEIDLQTQVKVLQSRSLIERTVDSLNVNSRPLPRENGFARWRKALGLGPAKPVTVRDRLLGEAISNLKVRPQPNTRIIELLFDSTDPQFAADFTNALAVKFAEQNLESRSLSSQDTGAWLTRQLQDLKSKLESSESQLQQYSQSSGIIFTGDKDNVAEAKLRQVQEELSRAQADRVAKQARSELASSAPPEALPEVLDDPTLRQTQGNLTDLRRQAADLTATLTPANPKVLKLQAQIASLESTLEKDRDNITRRIRNEYESAKRRESLLAADYAAQARLISAQAAQLTHYDILKREVDTTRQLYDSMLQKVKEATVAAALRASNVRVVDPARTPLAPYKPSPAMNAAFGLVTFVFAGYAIVLMRDRADRSIRAPGDVGRHLKLPELGAVPGCDLTAAHRLFARGAPNGREHLLFSEPPPAPRVELLVQQQRKSVAAECFRNVLTSILLPGPNGERLRVIALSSAIPGEGKTMVSCNLATALAETKREVLLIDGDMRKPSLHKIFGVDNSTGLSDCLSQLPGSIFKGLAQQTGIARLSLIPAGRAYHPDLIHSARLPELLRTVQSAFDIVLIDTPPALLFPDARILARYADGVILVVRAGQTTRDSASLACDRLCGDGARIIGTILNDFDPNSAPYGHYGDYYHQYSRYGASRT